MIRKKVNSPSHQRATGPSPSLSKVHNGWVEPCSHTAYYALGSAGPSLEDHGATQEPEIPKNQKDIQEPERPQDDHLLRTRKPPKPSKHSLFYPSQPLLASVQDKSSKMVTSYDCKECKESLYGGKYILQQDNPYCLTCYEKSFSNICEGCEKCISCTSKDLSYKDRHWHSGCFQCTMCMRSLVERPFATKDNVIMCVECYSNQYSAKCFGCLKTIMPGTKKMEHKGNSWHENCFTCQHCKQPMGTCSFVNKEDSNYCLPCYEKQFALPCVHCKKPITTGGVNYRDQPWHKECFVCISCKQQLSGQRFTSRDDFAYCMNCFCNLFAKKCAYCTTPISGLGGSKYVLFEERQWHNDCFNCKKCSVSLIGRGFLSSRDDVLCPDCGKEV